MFLLAQWTNTKTCWKSLKIGHKIHLAHIPMPNRLCSISSGVFSFSQDQGRQRVKSIAADWKFVKVIPSSETCKPGLLPGWAAMGTSFSAGAANTRYLHDQRNLVSTALWGTREALYGPRLCRVARSWVARRLTSQRCCVFLTAPACTFSGGRSTPWKGPIQVPCWILCAAQMP